jgi:tRNA threonylcarbamoyladenosine biosynthesis protein TsaB
LSLIVNIDTATEIASVCATLNSVSIGLIKNQHQKEHASFVHLAIREVLKKAEYTLKDVDAFAITAGPGSYTGLRVGMATAKGFCYALSKPLIAINTLEVMTKAAINELEKKERLLFCPMIDARRMEVFTAIYNVDLEPIFHPAPVVLEEGIFDQYLEKNMILFFGSGSEKFRRIETNFNSIFANIQYDARHLGSLAEIAFHKRKFSDISYVEPTYLKEFQSILKT